MIDRFDHSPRTGRAALKSGDLLVYDRAAIVIGQRFAKPRT